MSRSQLVDVSAAEFNVVHMSKMIQVRNVPDEMHRALKATAAAEGMSLSDYIKRELAGLTDRSGFDEIEARIKARGPSKVKAGTVVQILRESRGAE